MRGIELVFAQAPEAAALCECVMPVNAMPRYLGEHAAAELGEAHAAAH